MEWSDTICMYVVLGEQATSLSGANLPHHMGYMEMQKLDNFLRTEAEAYGSGRQMFEVIFRISSFSSLWWASRTGSAGVYGLIIVLGSDGVL